MKALDNRKRRIKIAADSIKAFDKAWETRIQYSRKLQRLLKKLYDIGEVTKIHTMLYIQLQSDYDEGKIFRVPKGTIFPQVVNTGSSYDDIANSAYRQIHRNTAYYLNYGGDFSKIIPMLNECLNALVTMYNTIIAYEESEELKQTRINYWSD